MSLLASKTQRRKEQCHICSKYVFHLAAHLITHTNNKPFKCKTCGKRFNLINNLRRHEKGVHEKIRIYSCIFCDQTFASTTYQQNHLMRHIEEKPYSCEIDQCEKTFCSKQELCRHILVHKDEKPHKCSLCNAKFKLSSGLLNHEFRNHPELGRSVKLFECNHCQKFYYRKQALKIHKLTHAPREPLQCDFCRKRFSREFDLHHHLRIHTKEKIHICSICSKSFSSKTILRTHQFRQHQMTFPGLSVKEYNCSVCGKLFYLKSKLKEHMSVHAKVKRFRCRFCEKKFKRKGDVYKHESFSCPANPEKIIQQNRFWCLFCTRDGFRLRANYFHHLMSHIKELPFTCRYCDASFVCASCRKQHVRKVHV